MKGTKTVRKRLADGTIKTYSYQRQPKPTEPRYLRDSVGALVVAFKQSPEWANKSWRTHLNYLNYLRDLERLANVTARDIKRRDILELRDAVAQRSGPAAANYFVQVCSAVFGWAVHREWIDVNPASGIKKLPCRSLQAWTAEQAEQAMQKLPEPLRRAVLLGMYTGQRRGDLCSMRWSAYDGTCLLVNQQKTKVELRIPVHARLRDELTVWKREATSTHILTSARGTPWTPTNLSDSLPPALQKAGLPKGLNVHGLRKLAATLLAEAGCTTHEIAAITGHKTLAMIAFYTKSVDQQKLAQAAISRLKTIPVSQESGN